MVNVTQGDDNAMHKRRNLSWVLVLVMIILVGILLPVGAQDDEDNNNRPIAVTPGEPIGILPTPTRVLGVDECLEPLPIEIGQTIYIKPDVNIRSAPDGSSPIVWNTMFNNRDEDGEIAEQIVNVIAIVTDGSVCTKGFNWWQVNIPGNNGWVAEGRYDRTNGYLIDIAGLNFDTGCSPRYDIQVGETVDLITNVRVRTEPNAASRTITVAPAGTPVNIVGGAECVNGYQWWLVQVTVLGAPYSGWMAEGNDGIYWLLPDDIPNTADGTLCDPPLPYAVGQQGYVFSIQSDSPRYLRAAPGVDSQALFVLVENTPFEIVGEPVCASNMQWWQVRILSSSTVIGWVSQGSSGVGWWITVINPEEYQGFNQGNRAPNFPTPIQNYSLTPPPGA